MKATFHVLSFLTGGLSIALSPLASADFLNDSKANLTLRNFYFNNDNRDGAAAPSKTEEWGQAFMLNYQSGFTDGTVGFGLDAIGLLGLKLDSGAGRHVGGSMFPNDGDKAADQSARMGATAKMRFSKTELRYGTLQPKLPILVANDGRLLPQTFEGGQVTSNEIDNLTITAGQLEHATGRASTDSAGLAVAGGTRESNKFTFAGGDYKLTKDLTVQYYYANLEDYYSQNFLGLVNVFQISPSQSFKTDLRYFNSKSDGRNGQAGYLFNNNSGFAKNPGEVDNNTWAATFTYTLGGNSFLLGHQQVGDDGGFAAVNNGSIRDGRGRPEGEGGASYYLVTDVMINSFIRAGENTTYGQYAYDFASLGVPGLKASLTYLHADGIKDATGNGSTYKEWERDYRVDYVVQSGVAKGLGFSLRRGNYRSGVPDSQGGYDTDQTRFYVNYTYSFM